MLYVPYSRDLEYGTYNILKAESIVVNDPLEFVFLYLNLVIQLDLLYKLVFELILVSFLIKSATLQLKMIQEV